MYVSNTMFVVALLLVYFALPRIIIVIRKGNLRPLWKRLPLEHKWAVLYRISVTEGVELPHLDLSPEEIERWWKTDLEMAAWNGAWDGVFWLAAYERIVRDQLSSNHFVFTPRGVKTQFLIPRPSRAQDQW
jgi:hypothetical protein